MIIIGHKDPSPPYLFTFHERGQKLLEDYEKTELVGFVPLR
jgi:hypothetical protein